ncbi:hypothetical protein AK830_g1702 [Neonectria ditissima]|uniref:Alkaline ceramidase 3 n=1 Tax=Neonectria ditissima TaxID=78410 RepID=A0A0P7BTY4_9HYPO|nr:hypothetical protein AK830_g1702 [Neonectria ditissima]
MANLNLLRALRAPYPDQGPGFWGEQTSTLNFCEEDYVLSFYCAELCNVRALYTDKCALPVAWSKRDSELHPELAPKHLPSRALLTTSDPMQLVDELSMIYTTCLMMYASFSFSQSKAFSVILGTSLLGLATFITLYYHLTKDPNFHQTAYGLLTALVVFRSMWVMESQLRPALETRGVDKSRELLKTMWAMVITGLGVFLGGYFLWTLDNEFCSQVTGLRHAVGLPWAVVLEGHAWWHLMTGLGGNATLIRRNLYDYSANM